jgi:hypothetical protein
MLTQQMLLQQWAHASSATAQQQSAAARMLAKQLAAIPCAVNLQEYVSLSFSPDGKLLLAQGGGPDWNLLLWAWEKSKVASSIRSTNLQGSPVVQVSKHCAAAVYLQHDASAISSLYGSRSCSCRNSASRCVPARSTDPYTRQQSSKTHFSEHCRGAISMLRGSFSKVVSQVHAV